MKYKTVDQLAELQAQIADLSDKAERLKERLKERGEGRYEGSENIAVVSTFMKTSLNTDKVKKLLTPAQLRRVTVKTETISCRIVPIEA